MATAKPTRPSRADGSEEPRRRGKLRGEREFDTSGLTKIRQELRKFLSHARAPEDSLRHGRRPLAIRAGSGQASRHEIPGHPRALEGNLVPETKRQGANHPGRLPGRVDHAASTKVAVGRLRVKMDTNPTDENLEVTSEEAGHGVYRIRVRGNLELATSEVLRNHLAEVLRAGHKHLMMDLN